MARITLNISNKLNEDMRRFIQENNISITTFTNLAISKYLESQSKVKKSKS